jgi:hypothetical protein
VENLLRPDGPTQRWRLTLIFGLAHGLGFAGQTGSGSRGTANFGMGVAFYIASVQLV